MNCKQCDHKKNPDGGHCYMFRVKPDGSYCAQYRATDSVRMRVDLVKLLGGVGSTNSKGVMEHK